MSPRAVRGIEIAEVDEAAVASYLEACPEFFDRHVDLLARVRLPDTRGGGTMVSLLERQVEVLRERSRQLERKLAEFIEIARDNDTLTARMHRLARRLMAASGRAAIIESLELSLREDFGAEQAILVLREADDGVASLEGRFVRFAAADDAVFRSFTPLLESGRPRCGQLRDSQRQYLFGANSVAVGSAALVPLGAKGEIGLLACGSSSTERFNPGMSTDYLGQIAELIAAALSRG